MARTPAGYVAQLLRTIAVIGGIFCASCTEQQDMAPWAFGRCSVSPDGSAVFFKENWRDGSDIYRIASDGSGLTRLTSGPSYKSWPWVSPDGKSIAYISNSSNDKGTHVFVMDTDGHHARELTLGDYPDVAPSYSPDGRKIIFVRAARHRPRHWGGMTWDQCDIWQINADGSSPRQLTFGCYPEIDPPYFSPDGKHVLFAATTVSGSGMTFRESHHLFIFDIGNDGSAINLRPVPLPPQPEKRQYDGVPSFSPDGSTIVFASLRVSRESPYDYEIWTAGADGSNLRQITHNLSRNQDPIFSHDGKFIYFYISGLDLYGLWRMRADGSDAQQLTESTPPPNDTGWRS